MIRGVLWRDVVNLVGESEPGPDLFWPLINHVAHHYADHSYFLGRLGDHLNDPGDRQRTLQELRWASVGFDIWQHQRHALVHWLATVDDAPVTPMEIQAWWLSDAKHHDLVVAEVEKLDAFLALVTLPP